MQKSSYFPSPLRKDYTTKPVKNYIPIIIAQTQRSGTARDLNPQDQKIIKYKDGLLVKIVDLQSIKSGIFFMNDHSCILFNILDQRVHGKNYIVYPSGIIMSANYDHGKLNSWLVAVYQDKFVVCHHFRRGIKDGQQYFYDVKDKLLITSFYRKGKLVQIKNGEVGEFHQIIKNQQILQRVSQIQTKHFQLHRFFPMLKIGQMSYYGQLNDTKDTPNGYGIMIGQQQIFMGNFLKGMLNGLGAIKFHNNELYFGEFKQGSCVGYGSINDGKQTKYQFGNQTIAKGQFDEFVSMVSGHDKYENWANKFNDLEAFHHQFKNKSLWEQNLVHQSKQNSDVIVDVAQSHNLQEDSDEQDQDFQSQSNQMFHSFSKHKPKNIPILSLSKNLKVKSVQQQIAESGTQRINQKSQNKMKIHRRQSRTQRPSDIEDNNTTLLKVPDIQKEANNQSTKKKQKQKEKEKEKEKLNPNIVIMKGRQQHLGTQNLTVGKEYVSSQYHFMRPNQMKIKPKMGKVVKQKLEKNWNSTKIDMGKIMKVGSDVSSGQQQEFLTNYKPQF